MKKLKESVHAIQVGCQICEGPHLDKDCPLNEEVKQVEEVKYGEFGQTTPFNGNNGGKFRVGPPRYYTKTDNRPLYGEMRQSLKELLAKHQEESARRSTKMEVWFKKLQENAEINTRNQSASLKNLETQIEQLTKEIHSNKTPNSSSRQIKIVTANQETSVLNKLHGMSFISKTKNDTPDALQHQLPPKELNPKSFTLPCTIGKFNFYAMADLGASINVMPRSIFEHLHLTNLKKTNMLCEMENMSKKVGHTDISEPVKKALLKLWLIDCFQDDSAIVNNLTNKSFDDYKLEFNLEINKLADEYELGIGKKGHILDNIWI
ncbi:reverse transcriptase domain-containing protein [Tanacetum coccineum]